jgi:hypothetical protein
MDHFDFIILSIRSGKGSHWGTIEQQFPMKGNEKLELPPKPEVKEEKKKGPVMKNFLTAPSKKGSGYGYANVTIGKYYPYESDPYDLRVVVERVPTLLKTSKLILILWLERKKRK